MAKAKNKKHKPLKKSGKIGKNHRKVSNFEPELEPILEDNKAPEVSELLSQEEIENRNKQIEGGEQAKPIDKKTEFPEGVFTPPKSEEKKESENSQQPPAQVGGLKGKPFNLTMCIDTFIGMICMFLFKNFDSSLLDLTNDELQYYGALEERCGIKFEINSPWFYFGALSMTYMSKIKLLIMFSRAKDAEEKQKKELKDKEKQENSEKPKEKDKK